jgi:hypothetical protein
MSIPNRLDVDSFITTWNWIGREVGYNFKVELVGKSSEAARVERLSAGEKAFTSEHFERVRGAMLKETCLDF